MVVLHDYYWLTLYVRTSTDPTGAQSLSTSTVVTRNGHHYVYQLYHSAEVYMNYIRARPEDAYCPRASAYIIHIHLSAVV